MIDSAYIKTGYFNTLLDLLECKGIGGGKEISWNLIEKVTQTGRISLDQMIISVHEKA